MPVPGKSRVDFWREEFVRFSRSGLTAQAYCKSRSISYSSFFNWKRRLQNEGGQSKSEMIEIPVIAPQASQAVVSSEAVIRIDVDGIRLSVPDGTDAKWLAAVLNTLRASIRVAQC